MGRSLRGRACAAMAAAALGALGGFNATCSVQAATYYVDPLGSDGTAGSAANPWRTLQYAADRVGQGDRVIVRPGEYRGFNLFASGAPAAPIQFLAEPGVLITQPNDFTDRDGVNLEGASHVVIEGFAVTGMPRAGVRTVGDEDLLATNVTVRNVHAYDNGVWGIFTGFVNNLLIERNETSGSADEHGIYVSNSGDWPVIRNNVSWGNHGSGLHMNGDLSAGDDGVISGAIVSGNRIFGNAANGGGGSGINMDGVQDSLIFNNLLYDNHASGISLYKIDAAEGSSGNRVVNNTVHQPSDGRWALNIMNDSTDNEVLNNIFVTDHSFRGSISSSSAGLAGLESNYNVVMNRFSVNAGSTVISRASWQSQTGQDANSLIVTPTSTLTAAQLLFVDPASGDYRLLPGALAIDAGASDPLAATDLAGLARPWGAGYDAGALEYTARWADFNNNGAVNGADLALWEAGFGVRLAALASQGDANRDGRTDGTDFLLWQRQVAGSGAAQPVPEPAAWALAALALTAVNRRGMLRGWKTS